MSWQQAVERTVTGLGFDLVEVERGKLGLVRVTIDRAAGDPAGEFITVEDCEQVTRQLQYVLEVEGCDYARLEVSSPGLDRRLSRPADWRRFAGREVELSLKQPHDGCRNFRGRLEATGAAWRLVAEGGRALDFALDEVRQARLVPVIDFKGRATPARAEPEAAHTRAAGGATR